MAENAVNNEENLNSQSSQLGEEDLQKLEADSVPVNTKKQTSWGLKKFTQWLEKRKISCDLHTVSPAELKGILRKFFAEVKTNKKTDLTPSALTGIRAAIHRTITGQPISRSINILKDVEFTQANKMFEVVYKSYYKCGNPKPQHKNPIEAGDMEKLNSYFSDKLQEFVWFNLCYYLGRRGREGWRELTKNSLEFKHDDQNKEYVTIKHTEQTKAAMWSSINTSKPTLLFGFIFHLPVSLFPQVFFLCSSASSLIFCCNWSSSSKVSHIFFIFIFGRCLTTFLNQKVEAPCCFNLC